MAWHLDIGLGETPFSRGRQGDGGVSTMVGASVEVMGISLMVSVFSV